MIQRYKLLQFNYGLKVFIISYEIITETFAVILEQFHLLNYIYVHIYLYISTYFKF